MTQLIKLDKTAKNATSCDPAEEFPYSWVDTSTNEIGFFHKTVEGALNEANNNYMGFGGELSRRNVIIVKAVGWANKV